MQVSSLSMIISCVRMENVSHNNITADSGSCWFSWNSSLWLKLSFCMFEMFVVYMKHIKRKMLPVLLVLLIYGSWLFQRSPVWAFECLWSRNLNNSQTAWTRFGLLRPGGRKWKLEWSKVEDCSPLGCNWDVTSSSLVQAYRRFRVSFHLHCQGG
jgi:hypothetical protein